MALFGILPMKPRTIPEARTNTYQAKALVARKVIGIQLIMCVVMGLIVDGQINEPALVPNLIVKLSKMMHTSHTIGIHHRMQKIQHLVLQKGLVVILGTNQLMNVVVLATPH